MIGGGFGLACGCSRSRCSSSTAKGPQLEPALDQASHSLRARGHFAVRVGPTSAPKVALLLACSFISLAVDRSPLPDGLSSHWGWGALRGCVLPIADRRRA